MEVDKMDEMYLWLMTLNFFIFLNWEHDEGDD